MGLDTTIILTVFPPEGNIEYQIDQETNEWMKNLYTY